MSIRQGNNIIAGGGSGGGSEEDNLSITKNASDKIQTIGVIDQNDSTSAIKVWTGELADLPAVKDPNTIYNITDDVASGGSGRNVGDIFYTKRTDTALAGAVECNGGTYNIEDYEGDGSIGQLLEAGKLDYISLTAYTTAISTKGWCGSIGWDGTGTTSFRVPTISSHHYIVKVQEPTAGNNYTWYRLYADGWVEQGGIFRSTTGEATVTINIPIPMNNNNYNVYLTSSYTTTGTSAWREIYSNKTTTSFNAASNGGAVNYGFYWQVLGMSNIIPESESRVMIQLFNGATDEAVATCTSVLADVSNLNTTTLRTNQITNCITEIPQDIKLELNNGTLTLKAGSKVYVPNGFESDGVTKKFDVITIENDLTHSGRNYDLTNFMYIHDGLLTPRRSDSVYSGPSAPVSPNNGDTWYDTINNIIKYYQNGVWSTPNISLPFAMTKSTTTNSYVSIDNIFNGFGYIGSTVFALPGVKGLIPDGRNADGSLKNIEVNINYPVIDSIDSNWGNQEWFIWSTGMLTWYPLQAGEVKYDSNKNLWLDVRNPSGSSAFVSFGHTISLNGKITSFTPKTSFHALDYNDSEYIGHQAMPSDTPIIITLGASGTLYTAPADGYFVFRGQCNSTFGWFAMVVDEANKGQIVQMNTYSSGSWLCGTLPVSKGQVMSLGYILDGNKVLSFVYANGAQ